MNNEKMGQFIAALRKSHQMTQKDLAAGLNVTDKSVSKWERGLSCPDISLLAPLSDILGVTIKELLDGERDGGEAKSAEKSVDDALQYAAKAAEAKTTSMLNISVIVFSGLLLLGIITCTIVDLAISGTFTWSLIPVSACVFTWISLVPSIKYGKKGTIFSLIMLSVLIVPFLFVLHKLIDSGGLLFPIGIRMAALSIVYFWSVFGIFKILRSRKLIAAAVCLLLLIPCSLAVNILLSSVIYMALFDVWDAMAIAILVVLAFILVVLDFIARKRKAL